MKPETCRRVMQTIDEQFQSMGFGNWEEGTEFAREVFINFANMIVDRARLERMFLKDDEPSPDELDELLRNIKKFSGGLRTFILDFAKKEIPADRGGRPSVLGTYEQRVKRVRAVLTLIGQKVGTTDALRRVAQKEGISLSSMQRIWRARGEAGIPPEANE